jgi:hypothetical protein
MFNKMRMINFEANKGGAGGGGDQGKPEGDDQAQVPVTFETWLEKQDATVKGLLDGHTKGLKSALESERESRKTLEKDLREMAKKADAGSDSQTKLTGMADQLAESDRKADFYDAAHTAGVSNLALAYLAAKEKGLIDSKNRVNFDEMKKIFPELFGGKPVAAGNAGNGTEGTPKGANDMNAYIRKAAGHST